MRNHPATLATIALTTVGIAALIASCAKDNSSMGTAGGGAVLSGSVKSDGSSTVFPIAEAVAFEFGKTQSTRPHFTSLTAACGDSTPPLRAS